MRGSIFWQALMEKRLRGKSTSAASRKKIHPLHDRQNRSDHAEDGEDDAESQAQDEQHGEVSVAERCAGRARGATACQFCFGRNSPTSMYSPGIFWNSFTP